MYSQTSEIKSELLIDNVSDQLQWKLIFGGAAVGLITGPGSIAGGISLMGTLLLFRTYRNLLRDRDD